MVNSAQQQRNNESQWFSLVMENAVSFLNSAVKNLDNSPKNSIIDLYTAIELILKARLMKEHWSLIISKVEEADIAKFEVGDFKSITLGQAFRRLSKICDECINEYAIRNFSQLGVHRNQIVHFAHTNFTTSKSEVVAELWASWFYLYELINEQWSDYFVGYEDKFALINTLVIGKRDYLEEVFKIKSAVIKSEISKGSGIYECPSCKLNSALVTKDTQIKNVGKMRPLGTWGRMSYPAKKFHCLVCNVGGFVIIEDD